MTVVDPRYLAARTALLDALEALAPHADSLIVAGAQAVYLNTGDADIAVAPYTTDGDLALDPTTIGDNPEIGTVLRAAGFDSEEPGTWLANRTVAGQSYLIPVDLIVPEGVAPPGGRRGARLGAHGNRAARRAVGLEAALVDNSLMTISSLDGEDDRTFSCRVAGVAALLVAKAHKIYDRLDARADRLRDKDALDVFRLMQSSDPVEVGAHLGELASNEIAGPVTVRAMQLLNELFGVRNGEGVVMAARSLRTVIPEERVRAICVAYMSASMNTSD